MPRSRLCPAPRLIIVTVPELVGGARARERESHLLNPPPGSTDPERFATVSIGIGDRVLFHPAPREPRHKWCEVSLRTEAGRSQATCLGLFDGLSVRPFQATSFHHHTAVPRPKRAAGVQCRHCHRPAGNFVAATDGVNESRTPSGTAPGARAEPVKPCPAFTLSGGPAPSRVGEFARNLRMHSQAFPAPPRQFCL